MHSMSSCSGEHGIPEKPPPACCKRPHPASVTVQMYFGYQVIIRRLPCNYAFGQVATEYLVVAITKSLGIGDKTEHRSNIWCHSHSLSESTGACDRVWQGLILHRRQTLASTTGVRIELYKILTELPGYVPGASIKPKTCPGRQSRPLLCRLPHIKLVIPVPGPQSGCPRTSDRMPVTYSIPLSSRTNVAVTAASCALYRRRRRASEAIR